MYPLITIYSVAVISSTYFGLQRGHWYEEYIFDIKCIPLNPCSP
jgi:hypothetical protein